MEILTVEEAARVLRVTGRTAQKMFRDGVIPGTKPGGVWKVEMETLREFLTARSHENLRRVEPVSDGR